VCGVEFVIHPYDKSQYTVSRIITGVEADPRVHDLGEYTQIQYKLYHTKFLAISCTIIVYIYGYMCNRYLYKMTSWGV